VILAFSLSTALAQGTAFTYQGRLNSGGNPANGSYDLTFALYDAASGGTQQGNTVTNSALAISNGLFTVLVDFGNQFPGANRWLEIGVRTNGPGSPGFVTLSPRQQVASAPYSITAATVTGPINGASILAGTVTGTQLAAGAVTTAKIASNSITGVQLAPGAAEANLTAGGLGSVPVGAVVMSTGGNSPYENNINYVKVGGWIVPDIWVEKDNGIAPPAGRLAHTAVWTGSEMIVWGGAGAGGYLSDGGRYDPVANNWTPMNNSSLDAPTARGHHTAVWTGSEMIVWGGRGGTGYLNDGARYNPAGNYWAPMSVSNGVPPSARFAHTAVWTGSDMIVWGGINSSGALNDGGRYNPSANSWTAVNTSGAPAARGYHTAVWTGATGGEMMVVWGGQNAGSPGSPLNDGGRYNPVGDSWTTVSTTGAPAPRSQHTAVWTGTEMIVWGGQNVGSPLNNGGRYNPVADSWTAVPPAGAPPPRYLHTAVWTGSEMIVWGG